MTFLSIYFMIYIYYILMYLFIFVAVMYDLYENLLQFELYL